MKKNIVLKIFCFIMICCFSFLFISCGYETPLEGEEGSELGGQTEEMENLYGVKVLYRPLNYDYDVGSGAEPGQKNDYYGIYAFQILSYLYNIYGIPDTDYSILKNIFKIQNTPSSGWSDKTFPEGEQDTRTLTFNYNYLPYLYDSIRYKVDIFGKVVGQIKDKEVVSSSDFTEYDLVGVDTNTAWEWSFRYDSTSYPSFMSSSSTKVEFNNHIYVKNFNETLLKDYYSNGKEYNDVYLGTQTAKDTENYSDFVKTLEYVIYCYALDLEPNAVFVTSSSGTIPYTVQINGYNSVDEALQARKDLFKKAGAFVGLSTRQINQISNWVKTNVIGLGSNITNDNLTYCDKLYEVLNASNEVIGYEPLEDYSTTSTFDMGRAYDKAVDEIIKYVCRYATIGKEEGGDLTVENRFLASEVIEYAGTTFYASSDAFFPKYDPSAPLSTKIRPLEYQSAILMPRGERNINGIVIALKYDADLDGTDPDEGFNTEKYIDIKAELNYYNVSKNKLYTIASAQTRVYDGSFVFGSSQSEYIEDGKYSNVPPNHGMLELSGFEKNSELVADGLLVNDDSVHLGVYDTSILPTDLAERNYILFPFVSKSPLTLLGTTDVRKYYKLLEPTADDDLEENQTYIAGRFNEEMAAGKCDYLEIVYKVLKDKNNLAKNYNFYTGIISTEALSLDYEP